MKRGVFIIAGVLIFFVGQIEGQWYRGNPTNGSGGSVSVAYGQTYIGFAVSSIQDCVRKTTDRGHNWSMSVSVSNPYDVWHCCAPSNYNHVYVVGANGLCLYSSNGGSSWVQRTTGVSADLYGVTSPTNYPQYVYVCGNMDRILKSTNYGQSWDSQWQRDAVFWDIYALNTNTIWACGSYGGRSYIIQTTNGGTTWLYRGDTLYSHGACYGIKAASSSRCFVVTSQGYCGVLGSSGTPTWYKVSDATSLYSVWTNNTSTVYAAGRNSSGGQIYKSTNGGITWGKQTLSPSTSSSMNGICFGTGSTYGAAVSGGGFYYTSNGGGPNIEGEIKANLSNHKLKIAPNPFSHNLTISLTSNTNQDAQVFVYDIVGKIVSSFNILSNKPYVWHARSNKGQKLPAGIYFIRVNTGSITATERAVKTK